MKKKIINILAMIVSKISEVAHWIVSVSFTVAFVLSFIQREYFDGFTNDIISGINSAIDLCGLNIEISHPSAQVDIALVRIVLVTAVINFAATAMIFRNIYLIIKKSRSSTPFNPDNVRMLNEIGIFAICIPIIGFIVSTIIKLAFGIDTYEISVDTGSITMGIIVLCLTQFFAHGVELENDVDGLL